MAKVKTFTVSCSATQAKAIAEALLTYAHAAYPLGGTECSQVAHETLLDSARTLMTLNDEITSVELRKRQRSIFAAAIDWCFSDEGPGDSKLHAELRPFFDRH